MILAIYCAGGFGKEVFDIAVRVNSANRVWAEIIFIDDTYDPSSAAYLSSAYPFSYLMDRVAPADLQVVIANGEPTLRAQLHGRVVQARLSLATLIDPSATVSPTARLGRGVIVAPYCSIASLASLGDNVAVNTQSIVGHDVTVGSHSVISSMVNLGGASTIGESAYIGMGSQIKEKLRVGSHSIISMGSIVHHDIPDEIIAMGNPARPIRRNADRIVFRRPSSNGS